MCKTSCFNTQERRKNIRLKCERKVVLKHRRGGGEGGGGEEEEDKEEGDLDETLSSDQRQRHQDGSRNIQDETLGAGTSQ